MHEVDFGPTDWIGIFGPKTFAFAEQPQAKYSIDQVSRCGPLTRAHLNANYNKLIY